MTINFSEIARENERKYGTEIDNYGPKLLADRYSDPAHFVFELLQNAEDALGERLRLAKHRALPRAATFTLFGDRLEFRHYGIPFAEDHIRAICNIARSSKQEVSGAIGRFGIGFKSVYAFTRSPEIHSCGESFVIESLVRPAAIKPKPTAEGETLFVLPFNHKDASSTESHTIIAERLRALGPRTLLFLRHIDEVNWRIEGGGFGRYLRESKMKAEGVEQVTLVGEQRGKSTSEELWLVFSRAVSGEQGASGFVEIAYQLQQTKDQKRGQIKRTKESPLCVYFATDLQTNLGFLVQGPFHLTQNRDNIRRDDKRNKALVREVAKLTVDSLFQLQRFEMLSVSALDAMPLERDPFETETCKIFMPVYEAVLQALKKHPLIPGLANRWVSGDNGFLVRGRDLTDLFPRDQIQMLFGCEEIPDWISPEITADKAPSRRLHNYIREALGVEELDAEQVCSRLGEQFFRERNENWFARFYRFLLKHESLWIGAGGLREMPIIRLADGSNVCPFGYDGSANAFLPTGGDNGSKTVHPKLSKGDALIFLRKLGIRERDSVAEVLEDVLPQYEARESLSDSMHARNLGRICRAWGQKESREHGTLLAKLKNLAFLRVTNAKTGRRDMLSPSDLIYFQNPQLTNYFEGESSAWFLAEPDLSKKEKHRAMLAELGVAESPSLISDWDGKDQVEKRRREKVEAEGRFESLTDQNLHGLENVLRRIRNQGKESPKAATILAKSLWTFLCSLADEGANPFESRLRWKKKHHRQAEEDVFEAYFVEVLRKEAWLPDRKGQFRRPGEMLEQELASGFERRKKLCEVLQFRTPRAELLKKAGLASEDVRWLELKERNPEAAAEFIRQCRRPSVLSTANIPPGKGQHAHSREVNRSALSVPQDDGGSGKAQVPEDSTDAAQSSHGNLTIPSDQEVPIHSSRGTPPRADHLQTRVRVEPGDNIGGNREGPEVSESRNRIDEAGVAAVKEFEELAGRAVTEMPHNHPGYDLESRNQAGELLRYIEVKSTGSNWSGVLLSSTQFRKAQELGDQFWLYVVENADSGNPRVYPIQDPAGLIEKFVFDDGWKAISMAMSALNDGGAGGRPEVGA